jgi:hypothetical protein
MDGTVRDRRLARVAGAAGIIAQLAASYFFVLVPTLSVPTPANYLIIASWFVLVGLAIAWWRHHPWRSFLVPIVSVPVVLLVLEFGTRFQGWAP